MIQSPHTDATVLSIIEALRAYFVAHADTGLKAEKLAQRWMQEQLFAPTRGELERAMRLMEKTRHGHQRVSAVTISPPSDRRA